MEKVCENWPEKAFISGLVDAKYWTDFEANATAAAAQVYKVADYAAGEAKLKEVLKEYAPKEIIAVGGDENPALKGIYSRLSEDGTKVYTEKFDIAEHAASADVGISTAEFGVGESGSLVVDNYSYEARVTSMLPFVNVVFVNAERVVF